MTTPLVQQEEDYINPGWPLAVLGLGLSIQIVLPYITTVFTYILHELFVRELNFTDSKAFAVFASVPQKLFSSLNVIPITLISLYLILGVSLDITKLRWSISDLMVWVIYHWVSNVNWLSIMVANVWMIKSISDV